MDIKPPLLDARTSKDIYEHALKLAKHHLPEWAEKWGPQYFDPEDPGLVVFKLFSDITEQFIKQYNKIPEKHFFAFLDFMGVDLLPPCASDVPLTFYLREGASRTEVPSGTIVMSSKDPEVVFETIQHLSAVNLKLFAFSVNPVEDRYSDHSEVLSGARSFSIFSGDRSEKSIDHILFIGLNKILNEKDHINSLRLKFQGSNLSGEFFRSWYDPRGNPIEVQIVPEAENNRSLIFDIKNIQQLEQSLINNVKNIWLITRPDAEMKIISGSDIPVISKITADLISNKIMPDSVIFNDTPLDMKKGFYPFGESPEEGDILYICSNEVLSKENSVIELNIELEKDLENVSAEHLWEFWDGTSWKLLQIINDGTKNFTKSGINRIEFICPAAAENEINGISSRWIRVKIKSGDYGKPEKYEPNPLGQVIDSLPGDFDRNAIKKELEKKGISFGFQYIPPSYNLPFIKSIHFVFSYKDKTIQNIMTYNNFIYKQFTDAANIIPFEPFQNEVPIFFLGFEEFIVNTQISIYFSVKEKKHIKKPDFTWKYFDGSEWKELSVEMDEPDMFNKSGIVKFIFPFDMKKSFEFGMELFWIKVEPEHDDPRFYPELEGIFPNTVKASNYITVINEVLGSGNGLPGQIFSLSRKSVLPGQQIEIKEGEKWIKWNETSDFAPSGKLSRDYVIDRAVGRIFFGDGVNGMVPPKGKNNIRAAFYRSGGGKKGNLGTGTIDTLRKANLAIDRVTNHTPSSGGEDREDNRAAVVRCPYTIRNGGFAITADDYEWLAKEASPDVKKARCIMDEKKDIHVIILTDNKERIHMPDSSLRDSVERYLKERALFTIREKIRITGPDLIRIDTEVTVKPLLLSEGSIISDKIKKRLNTFFDPVIGGQYGNGYDFGQDIYLSEVAAVIEGIEGVDYVEEIILKKVIENNVVEEVSGSGRISIERNAVPYAGKIEIKIRN